MRVRSPLVAVGLALALAVSPVPTAAAVDRAAAIRLAPEVGPPTAEVTVRGREFGATERVDLWFDATPVGRARTGGTGRFTARIAVPPSALPGVHTVTARGRSSGFLAHATFTVRTDWPKFHFDPANTGLNPYENVLDPSNVGGLALDWRSLAGSPGSVVTGSVAVVGGSVFVGATDANGDAVVDAFDQDGGASVWQARIPGALSTSGVAVADEVVYVRTLLDHALHAYDAATGATVWTFYDISGLGTPAVVDGVVYAGSNTYQLYALDAATGTELWRYSASDSLSGSPAVADGVVYIGSYDEQLYAVDASTGAIRWTTATGGDILDSPAVWGGTVYIGSDDHSLYAMDAATGSIRWSVPTGGQIWSSPAVAGGVVYVGSLDASVYAFDALTGAQLWRTPTGSYASMSPFVANGVVYVGSQDKNLYALDAATGSVLWSYGFGGLPAESGAAVDGRVYTGSQDGYLYAFALP